MKVKLIKASSLATAGRLDCWYFLSPAVEAVEAVAKAKASGMRFAKLGGKGGLASRVHHPNRYKRALAANGEKAYQYLRPYDVFNYLPEAADLVSQSRTENLEDYHLKVGQILQTRSGRNLGPAVIVDKYLAQFVMSDDMIRVEIKDETMRYFVLAYLNSRSGRQLLRRDKTGSVIDHLSEAQIVAQEIPMLESKRLNEISSLMNQSVSLREDARVKLTAMLLDYESKLPPIARPVPCCKGWSIKARDFEGRVDAAYYDPLVWTIRKKLKQLGGTFVADVADVLKPAGRYKTNYVNSENGRPLVSGAQLLQTKTINLQYMSANVFKQVKNYELRTGWIAYPADGRAEEELGTPVLVTRDRDGWLASGHIGRVIPKTGVDAGWLFLALKTSHAQMQLKARASGSVVDSTFANDMEAVILPPPLDVDGAKVRQLWNDFSEAQTLEEKASATVDEALAEFSN